MTGTVAGKPDALLLDEMFSPAIAVELAARGIDCLAVAADPLLRAQSDLEIFDAALRDGRVIVTSNVPDFESLRRAREAFGGEVPALTYTSDLTFPRTKAYVSRLVSALERAAATHQPSRHGGVLWLRAHPPDRGGRAGRPGGLLIVPMVARHHLIEERAARAALSSIKCQSM